MGLDDLGQPRPEVVSSQLKSPQLTPGLMSCCTPHRALVHNRVGKVVWMRPRNARGLNIPLLTRAMDSGGSVVKALGHWSEGQAPALPSCPTAKQSPWHYLLCGQWIMADPADWPQFASSSKYAGLVVDTKHQSHLLLGMLLQTTLNVLGFFSNYAEPVAYAE